MILDRPADAIAMEEAALSAWYRRLAILLVVVAGLLAASGARGQEAPGLSFSATPYLWIAGISGTVTTPFQRAPQRNVEVDFGDTLSNLSGLAFMGTAEMRYGRFGLLGDFLTLSVESDIATPRDRLFAGGTGRVTATMGSILGAYRIMEDDRNALDLAAGVRPWSISTRLSLNQGALSARTLKNTASWTDPVLGLRYSRRLGGRWTATFYGDVGGFGAGSDLTWQVVGTVDYRVSNLVSLRAGYRHMQVEHSRRGTDVDIGLSGPILAVAFRF